MRTNIEIDDGLMRRAMRACRCRTKRATVETALRELIRLRQQARIRSLFGAYPDFERVRGQPTARRAASGK